MLGGFLWCTGNVMTVPIIKCVGLSMGMLLWGLANLLMGWASGRFGLFHLKPEPVNIYWLNNLGAVIAAISGAAFAFIEPNTSEKELVIVDSNNINEEDVSQLSLVEHNQDQNIFDALPPLQKKIVGVGMAILAGILYGSNFDPPQYLIDNCDECSKDGMDYVFPHFCGIYITSTIYFLVYCIIKKNKPALPMEVAFPGFLSGSMWALADVCWFVANGSLSLVITFPTISIVPGVVASLWGILAFNEIRGRRNFYLFGFGFALTALSITCTIVSKEF
eukprot:TRINITY_DN18499_c0_g1_i1.p1 TRINITY_DN18499_c0_g1~~TRINITY_DN18499_c0_g1_i1.p1  ORF type:complete len:307 (-),score=45.46 TRINITY_DN18499_c0_g1_i1:2-832(-)